MVAEWSKALCCISQLISSMPYLNILGQLHTSKSNVILKIDKLKREIHINTHIYNNNKTDREERLRERRR